MSQDRPSTAPLASSETKTPVISSSISRIAIVGDGPMAMTQAIFHLRRGFTGEIYMIGPRILEAPTRSGDLSLEVFMRYAHIINFEGKSFPGYHIKSLEAECAAEMKTLAESTKCKLNLIPGKFVNFGASDKEIVVAMNNGTEQRIQVGLVYDGTGSDRFVMKCLNNREELKTPPFEFKKLAHVPTQTFAMIRVSATEQFKQLYNFPPDVGENFYNLVSPQLYARTIADLKAQGWEHDQLPASYGHLFEKDKAHLYFQISPASNSPEKVLEITRILMRMFKTACEIQSATDLALPEIELHKPSHKNPRLKKMVNSFVVDCKQASSGVFVGTDNLPTVVAIGDSFANAPFFTGQSLINGLDRMIEADPAYRYEKGAIASIDQGLIDRVYSKQASKLAERIDSNYEMLLDSVRKTPEEIRALQEEATLSTESKSLPKTAVPSVVTELKQLNKAFSEIKTETDKRDLILKALSYLNTLPDPSPETNVSQIKDLKKVVAKNAMELISAYETKREYTKMIEFKLMLTEDPTSFFAKQMEEDVNLKFKNYCSLVSDFSALLKSTFDSKYSAEICRIGSNIEEKLIPLVNLSSTINEAALNKFSYQYAAALLHQYKELLNHSTPDMTAKNEFIVKISLLSNRISNEFFKSTITAELNSLILETPATPAGARPSNGV